MFRTVGKLRYGYDPDQVDAFFTHARRAYEGDRGEPLGGSDVRRAAFDVVRGGYATSSVDAALDRLERAFAARQRSEFVAAPGPQAWMEQVAGQARTLYERLRRPDGERFAPARRGEQAYAAEDVDALLLSLSAEMGASKAAAEAARMTGGRKADLYRRLMELKGDGG